MLQPFPLNRNLVPRFTKGRGKHKKTMKNALVVESRECRNSREEDLHSLPCIFSFWGGWQSTWQSPVMLRSLWIIWLSLPTLYPYPPPRGSDNTSSSTYHASFVIMAYRRPLFLTEDLSLLLAFGSNYMNVWTLISFKAQPIFPRLTDRPSKSIKSLKICFVLVFWLMVRNGTNTFH
jgi:hypothetical protein